MAVMAFVKESKTIPFIIQFIALFSLQENGIKWHITVMEDMSYYNCDARCATAITKDKAAKRKNIKISSFTLFRTLGNHCRPFV